MIASFAADPAKWRLIDKLLQEALALPQDERPQWLDRLAGREPDTEVVKLLRTLLARSSVETDEFMSRPAASIWTQAVGPPAAVDVPGVMIGPYRLLRELGAGGMGTVWLAERADGTLQRQVAVKLPLHGWARGVAERLEQERDTLAALEHPNIARLYDAGVTSAGRPYLAMEYVDGIPIDQYAAEHHLPVRARLQLIQQVTRAVAYAHGRLIVHRDLKPSNILVTRQGEVRLLDFGAAKLLRDNAPQDSQLTREAGRALSPDYASPEQIRGEAITVATDVYSLGIVLFELLTGRRPYSLKRHSMAAMERAIAEADVPLPSTAVSQDRKLSRELRGDLDNIVAKALKKSPAERYGTVAVFADDLHRWLNHEPVSAQRDSLTYRMRKHVRRHRVAVAAGTMVFVTLAVASVVTTVEMFEARNQRDEARLQAKRAQAQERFANMVMEQSGPGGRPLTREEMIDRSVELLEQQYGNDPRFLAGALIPISGRYMDLGNTAKELAMLQKAEAIARQLKDPVLLINVQCNTVETELARGRLDLAEERMAEARTLLGHTPRVPFDRQIDCMHAEATLADARGDTTIAVERIQAAIALEEAHGDRTDRTYRALLSHAQSLFIHAGRPKDSYATVEKTLALIQETDAKNSEAIAAAMHNQSVALSQMGEVRTAFARERQAIAIISGNQADHAISPVVATVMGRLLTRMDRPTEGEDWAARAVAIARDGGNVGAEVFALSALAEARQAHGDAERASQSATAAEGLLTPTSDPRERAAVQRARALVELKRADLPAAQAAAAALLQSIGYPDKTRLRAWQSADVQLLLAARIALEAGESRYAARLTADALELALALARDPDKSANVGEARLLLARALYEQGEQQAARTALVGAMHALGDSLGPDHPLTIQAADLQAKL